MKLADLERHLLRHGCVLKRQGAPTPFGRTRPAGHGPLFPGIARSESIWPAASASSLRFPGAEDSRTAAWVAENVVFIGLAPAWFVNARQEDMRQAGFALVELCGLPVPKS